MNYRTELSRAIICCVYLEESVGFRVDSRYAVNYQFLKGFLDGSFQSFI